LVKRGVKLERVKTGIKGLDELLEGGFPIGSSILICGGPGAGKTVFALQYIYTGAKNNEPGVYVSIEEKPAKLREQARAFFRDFEDLEKKKKIVFLKIPVDITDMDIIGLVEKTAKEIGAKRIVIDSLSILSINAPMYKISLKAGYDKDVLFSKAELKPSSLGYEQEIKQFIYVFINKINDIGATTLYIADSAEQGSYLTRDTVSEFVCDGVLRLKEINMGRTIQRILEIKKMRNTNVQPGFHTLVFGNNGMEVIKYQF